MWSAAINDEKCREVNNSDAFVALYSAENSYTEKKNHEISWNKQVIGHNNETDITNKEEDSLFSLGFDFSWETLGRQNHSSTRGGLLTSGP